MLIGVSVATKKDGTPYYRSGITYRGRHISLGSFSEEENAFQAYLNATEILRDMSYTIDHDYSDFVLPFSKIVTLLNFRDNGIYFKTPIYIRQNYFQYFLTPSIDLKFDMDDLFYYSTRTISVRKGHYFVADYGMQVTIFSRYGIKNHSVKGRDYIFANGDETDFRYSNIVVINPYYGVTRCIRSNQEVYRVRIHLKSNYVIGYFEDVVTAAIAYNKAVDTAHDLGITKNFPINFIDECSNQQYAQIYSQICLPPNYYTGIQAYLAKVSNK
ncbi:MAG: hypothetical protein ACI39H_07130 [Lachnospiraceae bacterium]